MLRKFASVAACLAAAAAAFPCAVSAQSEYPNKPLRLIARAIERLARELNGIVATPDFREAMDKNGAEPTSNTPEQFATLIRQEADRYGKVVKALGIRLD